MEIIKKTEMVVQDSNGQKVKEWDQILFVTNGITRHGIYKGLDKNSNFIIGSVIDGVEDYTIRPKTISEMIVADEIKAKYMVEK